VAVPQHLSLGIADHYAQPRPRRGAEGARWCRRRSV